MGRPKKRDKKAEILRIVGELFLREGYAAVSMSRIAAAVGGSKTTLYSCFKSKEELFRAYMEIRVRQEAAELFVFPVVSESPAETLRHFGRRFLTMLSGEDSRALLRLLHSESPRFPGLGRDFYESCLLSGRKRLAAYLARQCRLGALQCPDPVLAAEQFLALCQATYFMEFMLQIREQVSTEEIEVAVDAALATFMAAYSK